MYVCFVCVCVCVCPSGIKNYSYEIKSEYSQSNNSYYFQFLCMALAINTIDGQALVTKSVVSYFQGNAVFAVHFTVKGV